MAAERRNRQGPLVPKAAALPGAHEEVEPAQRGDGVADVRGRGLAEAELEAVRELGDRRVGRDDPGGRRALPPGAVPVLAHRREEEVAVVVHEPGHVRGDGRVGRQRVRSHE